MKRVAIYVRVSTVEQKKHGYSVDNQIDALKEYCEQNNYSIQGIYNDAGISARKSYKKRPALLEMLNHCKNGEIDLVCFTRLDRFFRSVPDYYACIEQMNEVPWRAIWEDYETETASGQFKVNIMLAVAQSEADRDSERIKSVLQYKRDNGEYWGRSPFGYIIENKQLSKNPQTQKATEAFFSEYLSTRSVTKAVTKAKENGCFMSTQQAYRILKNRAYYSPSGKHEPYITEDEFNFIQRNLGQSKKGSRHTYLFSGLLRCKVCGYTFSGNTKINHLANGTDVECADYRCRGQRAKKPHPKSVNISERKIESYLLSELDRIIDEHNSKIDVESSSTAIKDYLAQRKKLEQKIERIGTRFEDGDISLEEYRAKRDEVNRQLNLLTPPKTSKLVEMPDNWKGLYETLDKTHKQLFWGKIIDYISISEDGISDIIFRQ